MISGVTIHNGRNTATVGYTGSLTGSRRKLAVSDYASTTGDYPIGMASPSVTVDSDVPVTLNAADGLLMLLPQSGTDTPDAWDTTTETPVTVATANTAGAEKSYLQVSCKIRYGDTYILGSASADDNVYIPMKADWEIGKRYTYTLDFSGDGSFSVDGSPSLTKICCITTAGE